MPYSTVDKEKTDLYIPAMAIITYVLVVSFVMGTNDKFTPDILSSIAFRGLITIIMELIVIKIGFYVLETKDHSSFLDITAYCGYKYVGIVISIIISIVFKTNLSYYLSTLYTSFTMCLFLMRTLGAENPKRRVFVAGVALLQIPLAFWLSYPYSNVF
jgi:hypothetical protein